MAIAASKLSKYVLGDHVPNPLEQCFSTPSPRTQRSPRKGVDESAKHTGRVSYKVKKRIRKEKKVITSADVQFSA